MAKVPRGNSDNHSCPCSQQWIAFSSSCSARDPWCIPGVCKRLQRRISHSPGCPWTCYYDLDGSWTPDPATELAPVTIASKQNCSEQACSPTVGCLNEYGINSWSKTAGLKPRPCRMLVLGARSPSRWTRPVCNRRQVSPALSEERVLVDSLLGGKCSHMSCGG